MKPGSPTNRETDKPRRLSHFLPWILPLLGLALWAFLSYGGLVPRYLLPAPHEAFETGQKYIMGPRGGTPYGGRFLEDALASLGRVTAGFSLAVLLGLPLGVLSGRLSVVRLFLNNFLDAMRAVPGIAWLPLALVWFGIGFRTTVFLVALAAFFPIYLNSAAAVARVDPMFLRAAAMLGLGPWRRVFSVLLPAAVGQITTGLRLGLGIAFAYLVLGELTGVPNGLGAVIMDARMLGRVDMILVGIVSIAILGRLSDRLLVAGLRLFFKSVRRTT